MTQQSFECVSVGSPISLVEKQYGRAYDVEEYANGIKRYRYIERISTSSTTTDYLYYIFDVNTEGRIIQKRLDTVGSNIDLRVR